VNVVIAVFITFMASIIIFVLSSSFLFSRFGALGVTNTSDVSQKTGTYKLTVFSTKLLDFLIDSAESEKSNTIFFI
jgi:hypothetical protein